MGIAFRTGPAGWLRGCAITAVAALAFAAAPAARADGPPPPNDAASAATDLTLPTTSLTGTLDGATVQRPFGSASDAIALPCGSAVADVWYRIVLHNGNRVVLRLASGVEDFSALLAVTRVSRGGLTPVECDTTDFTHRAGASIDPPRAGGTYLVQVATRQGSPAESGRFALSLLPAPPDPAYPGTYLPAKGARGVVDRLSNTADAYSRILSEGTTYRVNLAHKPTRCVTLRIFSPNASWDGSPSYGRGCGGYLLLTPGPGLGGRWTFRVETGGGRYDQDYRLSIGDALTDDMSPGRALPERRTVAGTLEGGRLDAIDLYHLTLTHRSHVVLRMRTASDNGFNLRLLSRRGRTIACACGERGTQQIRRGLKPGRYYVVVRARYRAHGTYQLRRVDRQLTGTALRVDGERRARITTGGSVRFTVRVHPAVGGRVDIRLERYDLLTGWHFHRMLHTVAHAGVASVTFRPPVETAWRADAHFRGSDQASPSDSRTVYFTVAPRATGAAGAAPAAARKGVDPGRRVATPR
jgi:hypothetical protein